MGSHPRMGSHLRMGSHHSQGNGRLIDLQLFGGEKTEPATPRKREESRKKGQVAKSGEVGTAALVLAGFVILRIFGPMIFWRAGDIITHVLSNMQSYDGTPSATYSMFIELLWEMVLLLIPIMGGLFLIAFVSQAIQVGLRVTLESVQPKFSRVNPLEGVKRIFSKRALVEFAKSLLKISVVGFLAYREIRASLDWLPGLIQMDILHGLVLVTESIFRTAAMIGGALFVVAVLDYLYQRWEFEQSIKMSKQEIKDEYKQAEGDPQIRSKIRQRQRQMASQRMMADVPKADVVITNPTHYAVALRYQMGEMHAPRVVAKGVGSVALRIRDVAEENRITLVENPPLARGLYNSTEIGQEIPADLYPAVAEVLAYVYRLRQKRKTR